MSTRLTPPRIRTLTRPLLFPRSAAILYFAIMTYVVLAMLNEVRPMWYFVLAAVLFVLSQLDFFLFSKVICKVRPAPRPRRPRARIFPCPCLLIARARCTGRSTQG